jgi:hypothetical protein
MRAGLDRVSSATRDRDRSDPSVVVRNFSPPPDREYGLQMGLQG